jgi:hypothetical protein
LVLVCFLLGVLGATVSSVVEATADPSGFFPTGASVVGGSVMMARAAARDTTRDDMRLDGGWLNVNSAEKGLNDSDVDLFVVFLGRGGRDSTDSPGSKNTLGTLRRTEDSSELGAVGSDLAGKGPS